jgi:hypothetical protein
MLPTFRGNDSTLATLYFVAEQEQIETERQPHRAYRLILKWAVDGVQDVMHTSDVKVRRGCDSVLSSQLNMFGCGDGSFDAVSASATKFDEISRRWKCDKQSAIRPQDAVELRSAGSDPWLCPLQQSFCLQFPQPRQSLNDARDSSPGDYVRVLREFSSRANGITSVRPDFSENEKVAVDVDRRRRQRSAAALLFFQ